MIVFGFYKYTRPKLQDGKPGCFRETPVAMFSSIQHEVLWTILFGCWGCGSALARLGLPGTGVFVSGCTASEDCLSG